MINKINYNCYTFKKLHFDKPLFNKTVDATYIIHLEGNGRYESLYNQIIEYKPTKIVYIVFNKGYKKCNKPSYINKTNLDLTDCNINIFRHAKEFNYDNILILEDDFILTQKIRNHVTNINRFLNKKKNKTFSYFLGNIPILLVPYDYYNYKNIYSFGTHAIIFSKKIRQLILKMNENKIGDWDAFNQRFWNYNYIYYKPLCYQLIISTDNQKTWGGENNIFSFLAIIIISIYNYLKLNYKIEPGYTIFYVISKMLFYILLLIIYYILKLLIKN